MALIDRLPFFRTAATPPPPLGPQERLLLLRESLYQRFYIHPIRAFWFDLRAVEELWPLVLPLLAWIGWRTYRTERCKKEKR